ncbi:MAG: hydrogenase maturation nickel metallochaperone HypA [Phycisphaerae bacterium]|nr:hydrogenase maturation nickel metallochaperone HypA [Phycisphaerae bacterium]
MHETSIASFLVEQASAAAEANGIRRVTKVTIRVGELSGVVQEALRFAWDIVTEATPCAGAALVIEDVPVTVRCPKEGTIKRLASPPRFRCPDCGEPTPELVTGRELELKSLEWDE